ncbi:hypothetical protein EOA60_13780 [Mesorhizobium sp. M1A.F.Ca.IN.020.06.1.1]|uniref:hypothetical protein n=1 Tax=unclassified Mesorhizobium TaxID=325217 RepID=UPI000BAEEA0D|nr:MULTISPECIES: hypothetical protein [unclassified Mesorhizobium]PBB32148.1 hypothetical protein CK214_13190 [Mesorhizobium sp. WSM3882]RUU94988.1 hypothetical protein EOA79_29570 [Mesorhizobium sp. M1A.F.Ca.IN.020.03.2.1]RUV84196.1 hypothetical protein EOA51_22740 [Mesorhizobium sp. M1A.F.Ca.IN.020.32.1.1]RUW14158.1 hypothetical protein EOA46_04375 [Mesorhizobium sp. M1A.F.Ca.IN.022.05.2.1]RUW30290.1 hypothetical protein EOA60_13780 [Mesorhizobium sp. M1A.F.Ca.IN.020.06.1.1]
MRKTVQLLLAASLCGCAATTPVPDSNGQRVDSIPISLALEEIITAGVRQHLKDPVSAKFGTMLAGERTLNGRHEIVVCGFVDDKRSAGGSSDGKAFIAKVNPDAGNSFELVAMSGETSNAGLAIAGACRSAGLAIEAKTS